VRFGGPGPRHQPGRDPGPEPGREPEKPPDREKIDMRHNGGGAPDGVVLWCSYLVDDGHPTHLNDIFRADTGETRQF
jgi:hypothetical protein